MIHRCTILVLVAIAFLNAGRSYAQEAYIEVRGKVFDGPSQDLLIGATCALNNHRHVGAITDATGSFHVRIPNEFLSDTLVISHIGFESVKLPLTTIHSDTLEIQLRRNVTMLDEVIVNGKSDLLKLLVLKAIRELPGNLPDQPHLLHGFYRKLSTEGNLYTHLEEASVSIQDYNYKRNSSRSRIQVHAFRQTEEKGKIDMERVQRIAAFRESGGSANYLYPEYTSSMFLVHHSEMKIDGKILFSADGMLEYLADAEFELSDKQVVDGDTIYHILRNFGYVIELSGNRPMRFHMGDISFTINKSTGVILEYQTMGRRNDFYFHRSVKYKKIGTKYYPYEIIRIGPRNINDEFGDGEYDIQTFWFDEVEIGKFESMPRREVSGRNDLEYREMEYDPGFWEAYEGLAKHPLDKDVLRILEKDAPLSEQFIRR